MNLLNIFFYNFTNTRLEAISKKAKLINLQSNQRKMLPVGRSVVMDWKRLHYVQDPPGKLPLEGRRPLRVAMS